MNPDNILVDLDDLDMLNELTNGIEASDIPQGE